MNKLGVILDNIIKFIMCRNLILFILFRMFNFNYCLPYCQRICILCIVYYYTFFIFYEVIHFVETKIVQNCSLGFKRRGQFCSVIYVFN